MNDGSHCSDYNHPDAVSWCIVGAIRHCYPCIEFEKRQEVMYKSSEKMKELYPNFRSLVDFNDAVEYEDVISLLKSVGE